MVEGIVGAATGVANLQQNQRDRGRSSVGAILDPLGIFEGKGAALEQQRKYTEQAAGINYKYGEMAAEEAYRRQMEMYEKSRQDQSYEAQVADMKKAGLSIGLMAGGQAGGAGSVGGGTQAQTGTGAGASPKESGIGIEMTKAMTELGLAKAQQRLLEADARGKEIENQNKGERLEAELTSILENIENTKVQREGQKIVNEWQQIENDIKKATKENVIKGVQYDVEETLQRTRRIITEIEGMDMDNEIKERTKEDTIKTVTATLKNIMMDTTLKAAEIKATESGTRLTNEMRLQIKRDYQMEWDKIEMGIGQYARGEEGYDQNEGMLKGLFNALILTGVVAVTKGKTPKAIKGFSGK